MLNLLALMSTCAPLIHPETLYPLIKVESSANPYAIAIVGGAPLKKQPQSAEEARAIIDELEKKGMNYSVGLGQINKANFARFGVTGNDLLDPCTNLRISQAVLAECYARQNVSSVGQALSCYYSGNAQYGFVQESSGTAYVERVANAYRPEGEFAVPSIKPELASIPQQIKRRPPTAKAPVRNTPSGKIKLIKSIYARQSFSSESTPTKQ